MPRSAVYDSRPRADGTPAGPCYACLFPPEATAHEDVACATTLGVLAPLVGLIGSLQAAEAIKLLAHSGEPTGRPAADAGRAPHGLRQHHRVQRQPQVPRCAGSPGTATA